MAEPDTQTRIMLDDEVEYLTGLKRGTRYALTKRGEFPSPVWIASTKRRGFLSDEIYAWINERRTKRSIPQDTPWTPYVEQGATQ